MFRCIDIGNAAMERQRTHGTATDKSLPAAHLSLPSALHDSALSTTAVVSILRIYRQFKSRLCNQSFFSFNNFRKPCNHPNLSCRSGDSRKLRLKALPISHDGQDVIDSFRFAHSDKTSEGEWRHT
jgi:hypothetical protein